MGFIFLHVLLLFEIFVQISVIKCSIIIPHKIKENKNSLLMSNPRGFGSQQAIHMAGLAGFEPTG